MLNNMDEWASQFEKVTSESRRILVISHLMPDMDAVASAIFTYKMLVKRFPKSKIRVNIEGAINDRFSSLQSFQEIGRQSVLEAISDFEPDLLLIVDANSIGRCCKEESDEVAKQIGERGIKSVVVDHHPPIEDHSFDLYIREFKTSCCEILYSLMVQQLRWETFDGYQDVVMYGILSDTGSFKYVKKQHGRSVFDVAGELLMEGADLEGIVSDMQPKYEKVHLEMFSHLCENFVIADRFNYSYITDRFVEEKIVGKVSSETYSSGYHLFMDQFMRATGGNRWGFLLLPDIFRGKNLYKCSFRAMIGEIDTTQFAKEFGGGGHKPASGFDGVEAKSVEEALERLLEVIDLKYDLALSTRKD